MLTKVALDSLVAKHFGRPFGLSFYVLQSTSVVFHAPASQAPGTSSFSDTAYWLSVVGCALPFVAVGLALTLRRLRDAGLPGLLALFFFVPILKFLFFVWKRVIAFPPLDPPNELLFRAGIAAPLAATIDGEGVGAVRRCKFTTGDFVEPIDVWRPGRELSFHVASQPDPMRELTLYPGPRPPHLDGYLESVKGQFVLEPQADGTTRLVGRTWYRTHMEPAEYWRLWGDAILHRIHLRVLDHVAKLAEADASRGAPAVE
jgi:hypothetical protein